MMKQTIWVMMFLLTMGTVFGLAAIADDCTDASNFVNNCSYTTVKLGSNIVMNPTDNSCVNGGGTCPNRNSLTFDCNGHSIYQNASGSTGTVILDFARNTVNESGEVTVEGCDVKLDTIYTSGTNVHNILRLQPKELVGNDCWEAIVKDNEFDMDDSRSYKTNNVVRTAFSGAVGASCESYFNNNYIHGGWTAGNMSCVGSSVYYSFNNNVFCGGLSGIDVDVGKKGGCSWTAQDNYCDYTYFNDTGFANCEYTCGSLVIPECSDGIDNDGDGFIDWPLDPDCLFPLWVSESFLTYECEDPCEVNETFSYEDSVCAHGWLNGGASECIVPENGVFKCENDPNPYYLFFDNIDDTTGITRIDIDLNMLGKVDDSGDLVFAVGHSQAPYYILGLEFADGKLYNLPSDEPIPNGIYVYNHPYTLNFFLDLTYDQYDFWANIVNSVINLPFWTPTDEINFIAFIPSPIPPYCNYTIDNILITRQISPGDLQTNESDCLDEGCGINLAPNAPGFDSSQCRGNENIQLCFMRLFFGSILTYMKDTITKNMLLFLVFLIIIITAGFVFFKIRN